MNNARARLWARYAALGVVLAVPQGYLQATEPSLARVEAMPKERVCDRKCLYAVLDQYLAALQHKDPWTLPWAKSVRTSENNVPLEIGDGLWGTITGLTTYRLRLADPVTGQVAYFGAVNESGEISPIVVRLKVDDGRISEAETLVRRAAVEGHIMAEPVYVDKPILNELVPPADRVRRERLISIANGYFDTLQLNDGTLFSQFDEHCNRVENGVLTTNNPALAVQSFTLTLGCAEQFKLGNFRYDDRLRARRFPLVDEERGLVWSSAFMDHEGRLDTYTLTDGRKTRSNYHHPHSYYLIELFKIGKQNSIQQIEAVFMSVPYHTRSAWIDESH